MIVWISASVPAADSTSNMAMMNIFDRCVLDIAAHLSSRRPSPKLYGAFQQTSLVTLLGAK